MPTRAFDGSDRELVSPGPRVVLSIAMHHPPGVIILRPAPRMIVGRRDADFPEMKPDVDLGPYAALESGISRRHAAITYVGGTIYIQDWDSTNGTYLNGQRLDRWTQYVLSDGDKLHFGRLETHIHLWRAREPYEGLGDYGCRVTLNQVNSLLTWSTNGRTWLAILEVAFNYGWQPALWPLPLGTPMPAEDALMLAQALEQALPDFPGRGVSHGFCRMLDLDAFRKPPLEPPLEYLGADGMEKVMNVIAFCRFGQFTVE